MIEFGAQKTRNGFSWAQVSNIFPQAGCLGSPDHASASRSRYEAESLLVLGWIRAGIRLDPCRYEAGFVQA